MKKDYPYLRDPNFLCKADTQKLQNQLIKITLLKWDETPMEEIQGIATGGTISLNGKSSLRRTCNLTMSVKDITTGKITDTKNLISINKKIFLEIGIKNTTNEYEDYPILWYPQGIFIFTQCSVNSGVSQGTTLSAQLKDKMCLLNGECGGTFTSSITLDHYDTLDDATGSIITTKPTIDMIIRELVNHFGGEQLGKILISDIQKQIKMTMKWNGSNPLYLGSSGDSHLYSTDLNYLINAEDEQHQKEFSVFQEFNYGEDVGFILEDFVYPGELVANIGDNICTILDKIKNLLGNYEYYYDIWGNFIFQEIKNYLNTTQATIDLMNLKNNNYMIDITRGKSVYSFLDAKLITSYSNNPQYNKIKNDFVIWGIKENAKGNKIPIRYHLAIDKKPKIGNIYEIFLYNDTEENLVKAKAPIKYLSRATFPTTGVEGLFYQDSETGLIYAWDSANKEYYLIQGAEMIKVKTTDWRSELYLQGVVSEPLGLESNYYYAELEAEWPKLYNIAANSYIDSEAGDTIYTGDFYEEIKINPWDVDYWLDFIDSDAAIGAFNISNIGRRSFTESKDEYNCVFEPEIPDIILIKIGTETTGRQREECIKRNQDYCQVDANLYDSLVIGGTQNSCFNRIKECLWFYTNYNSTISLGCLPIYHLEPNTRITVQSIENDIHGDYMIDSISIPLTISGNMNISASQVQNKI